MGDEQPAVNLLRVDLAPEDRKATTPLFRDPVTNDAFQSGALRHLTRLLMGSIGENPLQSGLHSYRIGGATALFAAGATPLTIRMMGRWSSDFAIGSTCELRASVLRADARVDREVRLNARPRSGR